MRLLGVCNCSLCRHKVRLESARRSLRRGRDVDKMRTEAGEKRKICARNDHTTNRECGKGMLPRTNVSSLHPTANHAMTAATCLRA